jgi:hypothetical protein
MTVNVLSRPATFSLPVLEDEIARLVAECAVERDVKRKAYLECCYHALMWARCPDGYKPPSELAGIKQKGERT